MLIFHYVSSDCARPAPRRRPALLYEPATAQDVECENGGHIRLTLADQELKYNEITI
jgi:hypothetical protein